MKQDVRQLATVTKREIEHLAEVNRQEHEALKHRLMAAFRKEFAAQMWTFTFALLGSFLTSTGVAVALAL